MVLKILGGNVRRQHPHGAIKAFFSFTGIHLMTKEVLMLQGKYTNRKTFFLTKLNRTGLRLLLRTLIRWKNLDNPSPGYTVAIASHWRFPYMLEGTLLFFSKQNLTHLDHVVCAIDSPKNSEWEVSEARIKERFPELKLEFLYQTPIQASILKTLKWGWIDAWLSFSKCIATAKTRYIILNDNDAILLDSNLVESRYQAIVERGDHFVGIRWYKWNGVEESDRILYTVNMAFDAQFIRNNCHPIECFNDVRILNGKTVDLDILHQCQLRTERRSVLPMTKNQMVHPSQVISQFSYLARGDGYVPPQNNNLFFIPYFEHLGGKPNVLAQQTRNLETARGSEISFLGYRMDLINMKFDHLAWIREQVERIEETFFGSTREEVEHYLRAIESCLNNVKSQEPAGLTV